MKFFIYRTLVLPITSLDLDGHWANVTTPSFSGILRVYIADIYPDEIAATQAAIGESLTRLMVHTSRLKELWGGRLTEETQTLG